MQKVALWNQKLSSSVVVWDYHVVLALKPHNTKRSSDLHESAAAANGPVDASSPESSSLNMKDEDRDREEQAQRAWVYDFDSKLPMPCKWKDYIALTFPYAFASPESELTVPKEYQSMFRIVTGEEYLENFASDRSHMIAPAESKGLPRYLSPPPQYDCLVGSNAKRKGIRNNLMSVFVNVANALKVVAGDGEEGRDEEPIGKVYALEEVIHWG